MLAYRLSRSLLSRRLKELCKGEECPLVRYEGKGLGFETSGGEEGIAINELAIMSWLS